MAGFFGAYGLEIMSFVARHWDVFLVYGLAILLIYIFRSRFEFQGIAALFKTKVGVPFMTAVGQRWPRFWNIAGYVSIFLGFLGMIIITGAIFFGFYQVLAVPEAPPVLGPVLPGVTIPGFDVSLPLWYGLFALFLTIIVHEGFHGIFSSAYNIPIKSSGLAFFGPIPGAFVEPDEKIMAKRPKHQQLAIFSAGPFANMILGVLAFGALALVGVGLSHVATSEGVQYSSFDNGSAAQQAGLPDGLTITAIDSTPTPDTVALSNVLNSHKPGDSVVLTAGGAPYTVVLGENPKTEGKAYLGILNVHTDMHLRDSVPNWLYQALLILEEGIFWTFLITVGIGLANLLPIGPVDGGRMLLLGLQYWFPEKQAKAIWAKWSYFLLFIVIVAIAVPFLRAIF